jgi:hypothetical protein
MATESVPIDAVVDGLRRALFRMIDILRCAQGGSIWSAWARPQRMSLSGHRLGSILAPSLTFCCRHILNSSEILSSHKSKMGRLWDDPKKYFRRTRVLNP